MGLMEQLTLGLGESPSTVVKRGWQLRERDLRKVLEARDSDSNAAERPTRGNSEVWPLLSHHRFNPGSLFGLGESGQVQEKALSLLLAYDGLVASDPLYEVAAAARTGHREQAIADLQRVVTQIAEVEPLIAGGLIRFTSARPSFSSPSRQAVTDALGLGNMIEFGFSNFEMAFEDVVRSGPRAEAEYVDELGAVFKSLSLRPPRNALEARRANAALASAVIYVSWQLAVCSEDSACDLTLTRALERHLLDEVITRAAPGFDSSSLQQLRGDTRHVRTLAAGKIPNLDTTNLTTADALALRRDGAFESFRDKLKSAMDQLPKDGDTLQDAGAAYSIFRERMQEAARELRESGKRSKLGNLMKSTSTEVGLGLGFSWLLSGEAVPSATAFADPLTKISMTVMSWLQGRRALSGRDIAMRYFATMGDRTQQ
ncbi:hypothetical protein BJG92_03057 [Arthrobacter sp. SO5]|uniref:hypothetical protein n=1 Tax=Arthrobacter sp. SO5 TaxID=1897055 RepID=UPI001E536B85|nr:hypothetical protein [Arthrobacter sp. SO5]MCB5275506.1 hypothetical protein [Arthrobacter sp. SO5]